VLSLGCAEALGREEVLVSSLGLVLVQLVNIGVEFRRVKIFTLRVIIVIAHTSCQSTGFLGGSRGLVFV
jgi:hypothetical protein